MAEAEEQRSVESKETDDLDRVEVIRRIKWAKITDII